MLYIANATKQNWNHHYQVPEKERPFFVQIPSGSQVVLGQGWNASQIDSVVKQLERYGALHVNDLSQNIGKFPGLLYRTDKPISEDQILNGHAAVVDAQEKRAATEASRAALSFDASTRDKRSRRRLAKTTEVSVQQDVPYGEKSHGDEVNFSLGVSEDGRNDLKLPQ
jgi:hypothetical protein